MKTLRILSAAISFLHILHISATNSNTVQKCKTAKCNKIAKKMLDIMDESVSPCDDFYQFSCGGFLKRPFPSGKSVVGLYQNIKEDTDKQLMDSMNRDRNSAPAFARRLVKKFYDTCTCNDIVTCRSRKPLLKDLKTIGGFPALDSHWNKSNFDVVDAIIKISRIGYGHNSLISIKVVEDEKQPTKYIIQVGQPGFEAVSQDNLVKHFGAKNDSLVTAYNKFMDEYSKLLGIKHVECKMDDVLDFEMSLASISLSKHTIYHKVDKLYNKMTVNQLQNLGNGIDWLRLLRKLVGENNVRMDDDIIVTSPRFIRKLSGLLKKYTKRTVANYLSWKILFDASTVLDDPVLSLKKKFDAALSKNVTTEKQCIRDITGRMKTALSAVYIADHFNPAKKRQVENIVTNVKKETIANIARIKFMDDATKRSAVSKLKKIVDIVAYPDELRNTTTLEKFLKPIKSSSSLYGSKKNLLVIDINTELGRLKGTPDRHHWTKFSSSILEAKAYHKYQSNLNVLTAAFLQGIFFEEENPKFNNYGGVGQVYGHETNHAIDPLGNRYDENGYLNLWWTNQTTENFKNVSKCFVDQYNKYRIIGRQVNGSRGIRENLSDNWGMLQAYLAYLKVKDSDQIPHALNYTRKQLFWISSAQLYCEKRTRKATEAYLYKRAHAPFKFRAIGSITNRAEFALDFNCKSAAQMNPQNKCTFW